MYKIIINIFIKVYIKIHIINKIYLYWLSKQELNFLSTTPQNYSTKNIIL